MIQLSNAFSLMQLYHSNTCNLQLTHTMFCILPAISKVRSAVVPPAPQVMSQNVGSCVAMRSILSNKFSTPCATGQRSGPTAEVDRSYNGLTGCSPVYLLCSGGKELEREERFACFLGCVHLINHLHLQRRMNSGRYLVQGSCSIGRKQLSELRSAM